MGGRTAGDAEAPSQGSAVGGSGLVRMVAMTAGWTDCEGFHRRDFLKIGSAGLLGLTLPDLLRLEARAGAKKTRRATNVIMVWLAGGPATIDMWDLKPEAPEGIRGEFKEIATRAPGIRICEHLPHMAAVMPQCTLVRSLYHNISAHELGTLYMTTGNKPSPAVQYPSLGSLAAKLLPSERGVPSYVSFGVLRGGAAGGAGYLGAGYNPFEVEGQAGRGTLRVRGISLPTNFTQSELENRYRLMERFDQAFKALDQSDSLAAGLDRFQQEALDILRSDRTRKAFDIGQEPTAVRQRYGEDPFGASALAARRLIEAGVRFVTLSLGGWDTHSNNFTTLKQRLLPQLDRTLSALIEDLHQRGLLATTVVYCAGEFGRTPRVNRNAGRDHWGRALSVLLAGGGFKPGIVYGSTDKQGMTPQTDPCTPDDVSATIFHLLGVDPYHELMTSAGRPLPLFREGKVLEKIVG
ncbi:MAG: DUF1501 domain-containing protein [Gemmataceae bacterium]